MIKNEESRPDKSTGPTAAHPEPDDRQKDAERPELVALFRLLMREPPADHDFRTCPICKRHGISRI
jgi:hypothetical protein